MAEECGTWITCPKCGKRIIRRLENGLGEFKFGRQGKSGKTPVYMEVCGMVRIRCLSWDCDHVVSLTFFPMTQSPIEGFDVQSGRAPNQSCK